MKNVCLLRFLQRGFTNLEKNLLDLFFFYFLCLCTTRIGFFVLSAFFLNLIYAGLFKQVFIIRRYDPLGKQETRKIFFINKYQLSRRLNTDFAFTSDLSLHCVKQRWAASYTWDFLIARSPEAPSKIYSPLSPKEGLILTQATYAFYRLW